MNAAMFLKIWGWIKWLITFGKAVKPVVVKARSTVEETKRQLEMLKLFEPDLLGLVNFKADPQKSENLVFRRLTPQKSEDVGEAFGGLKAHTNEVFHIDDVRYQEIKPGEMYEAAECQHKDTRTDGLNKLISEVFHDMVDMANERDDRIIEEEKRRLNDEGITQAFEDLEAGLIPVPRNIPETEAPDAALRKRLLNMQYVKHFPLTEEDVDKVITDANITMANFRKDIDVPMLRQTAKDAGTVEANGELEAVTVMAQKPYGQKPANEQSVNHQDNKESADEGLKPFPTLAGTLPPEFWGDDVKLKPIPRRLMKAHEVLEHLPRPEPIVVNGRPTQPEEETPIQVGEAPAVFDPDSGTWKYILVILEREQKRLMKLNCNSLLSEIQTSGLRGQIAFCERLATLPKLLKDGRI